MPKNTNHLTKNHSYTIQVLKPAEINSKLISAWDELEARAIVPNAFLSPHFVLPALRYLESSDNTFGLFVERSSGGLPELVGVALFQARKPTRKFPLKHLAAFASVHSYLSDFLIDQEDAHHALKEIYGYLTNKQHAWHGLYLSNISVDGLFTEEAQAIATDFGMKWKLFEQWSRAIFLPGQLERDPLGHLSKGQKKNHYRSQRKLQELGTLEWVVQRGTQSLQKSIEEFVRLEHMGWKGEGGTSLYSNANHLRFFIEMMTGFNQKGRAFFTELKLNGKNIASTSNLISGKVGFGFKVGWDIEYAKYGPGTINEIKALEEGYKYISDLEYMDSSAGPDSYMNDLWPRRRELCEGMFCLTPAGRAALASVEIARKMKNALFRRRYETAEGNGQSLPSEHSETTS